MKLFIEKDNYKLQKKVIQLKCLKIKLFSYCDSITHLSTLFDKKN